ncbi:MAG: AMP-binding protein, partial [Paracoccaceae bacterium]
MQVETEISEAAPTNSGLPLRPADFATFAEALAYAARGATGFTYYNARGEVVEVLLYRRLLIEAREIAARYLALGLKPGDTVAILAETEPDFARAFCGAMLAGLVPAPLPLPVAFGARDAYSEQLRRIVAVADARVVITPAEYGDWVAEAMAPVALNFCGRLADLPRGDKNAVLAQAGPDDLAYLQFSSGTTGSPKGIAVTNRSMMANLHAIAAHGLKLRVGDRGVSWLPLYHDMGLVGCFLTPIATQFSADHIATKDFIRRPLLWLELIDRNRATITFGPTLGYDLALRRSRGRAPEGLDLSTWRVAGIGADMVKAPVIRAFARTFAGAGFDPAAFTPSYGMAETTLALSFAPLGQGLKTARLDLDALERRMIAQPSAPGDGNARDFALCGPPLPDHEIEIRDETGAVLGPNQV